MRVLMDEVFGEGAFRSEIIWVRRGMDLGDTAFACAHETILHYALSPDSVFNAASAATDVWTGIEGLYDVNAALGNYPHVCERQRARAYRMRVPRLQRGRGRLACRC